MSSPASIDATDIARMLRNGGIDLGDDNPKGGILTVATDGPVLSGTWLDDNAAEECTRWYAVVVVGELPTYPPDVLMNMVQYAPRPAIPDTEEALRARYEEVVEMAAGNGQDMAIHRQHARALARAARAEARVGELENLAASLVCDHARRESDLWGKLGQRDAAIRGARAQLGREEPAPVAPVAEEVHD